MLAPGKVLLDKFSPFESLVGWPQSHPLISESLQEAGRSRLLIRTHVLSAVVNELSPYHIRALGARRGAQGLPELMLEQPLHHVDERGPGAYLAALQ